MVHGLLSGFGLATASGLNAYLPLLVVGLLARWTDLVRLNAPYDLLSHPAVLVVLAVLCVLDFVGDKIPVVDHVLHAIGLVVHPAAGAVVFLAANSSAGDVDPVLAAVCGLALAGGTHVTRASARPAVTATTGGLGNWLVSLIEDVSAFVLAVLAVLVPLLAVVVIVAAGLLFARTIGRAWRRLTRKRLRPPPLPAGRRG
jgi:hypothetical protein